MSAKNQLQEYCQEHGYPLPRYETKRDPTHSADHTPCWTSTVSIGGVLSETVANWSGKKVSAEKEVARVALERFTRGAATYSSSNAQPLNIGGERPAHAPSQVAKSPPGTMLALVMVDADQIAFVDARVCGNLPSVMFRMYHAHGANLPHIKACETLSNVTVLAAPHHVADMADTMMTIDAARTLPNQPVVIVSRDKALYNVALLLENVQYVSTLHDLAAKLQQYFA